MEQPSEGTQSTQGELWKCFPEATEMGEPYGEPPVGDRAMPTTASTGVQVPPGRADRTGKEARKAKRNPWERLPKGTERYPGRTKWIPSAKD